MSDHSIRLFASDAAVRRVGEGLLARTLPKAEWTHEAHLAACAWLLLERPEVQPERDLPDIIRTYNVAVGGVNDDTQGYHDTITKAYLRGVRLFLEEADRDAPLHDLVNDLLHSPMGRRDWPLRFWSKERLFSVDARRGWVEPDIRVMP